jgi:predicted MPP superfamily phosphohydrolase
MAFGGWEGGCNTLMTPSSSSVPKARRRGRGKKWGDRLPVASGDWLEQRPLHLALVAFNGLSKLPAAIVALILLGLATLVGLAWQHGAGAVGLAWGAGGVFLAFVASDWLLLWLLPRKNISYGPVEPPLLALAGLRWTLALAGVAFVFWTRMAPGVAMGLVAILYAMISAVSVYGVAIEPFRLGVTEMALSSPKLSADAPPVRVLQMGDFHIERLTRREHDLLAQVAALAPDVILLTGDYLNLSYVYDKTALKEARKFLRQLAAPFGVYAVSGSPPVDPPAIVDRLFDGLDNSRLLRNEHVALDVHGQRFYVVGLVCSHDPAIDPGRLKVSLADVPRDAFTIVLYHSPDLMPEMVEAGVDLYLAGHTHGGQIRLPLYGAVLTSSVYGKRYEMGPYQEANTHLYVARGIGMEGMGAPRARFLSPPEIVLWTLAGQKDE